VHTASAPMFVLPTFTCALLWATIPLVSSTPFFPTFTPIPDGINCKGDISCEDRGLSPTVSQEIANIIDVMAGPDDRWYAAHRLLLYRRDIHLGKTLQRNMRLHERHRSVCGDDKVSCPSASGTRLPPLWIGKPFIHVRINY